MYVFNIIIYKHTNLPKINKEFILEENSEDEEHNSFHRHGKQVLPDKIPGQRVQILFSSC